jgi:3-isopropylmalate/(R)-2-methylmalate dehydratase large subunit
MAVEAGGFTGIIEAGRGRRGLPQPRCAGSPRKSPRSAIVKRDPDATYLETFEVDLSEVEPMVATPGDPRNGVRMSALKGDVKIQIAYGGSCTGGKKADMDMYAAVLGARSTGASASPTG